MSFDTRTKEEKDAVKRENAGKLSLGSRVRHKTFGMGEITHIDKENCQRWISSDI